MDLSEQKLDYKKEIRKHEKRITLEEACQVPSAGEETLKTISGRGIKALQEREISIDMEEDDLREFLMHRIAELREAADKDKDEDKSMTDDADSTKKITFKASTIADVFPVNK